MSEDTRARDNTKHDNNYYLRGEDIVKRCPGYGEIAVCEVDYVLHAS